MRQQTPPLDWQVQLTVQLTVMHTWKLLEHSTCSWNGAICPKGFSTADCTVCISLHWQASLQARDIPAIPYHLKAVRVCVCMCVCQYPVRSTNQFTIKVTQANVWSSGDFENLTQAHIWSSGDFEGGHVASTVLCNGSWTFLPWLALWPQGTSIVWPHNASQGTFSCEKNYTCTVDRPFFAR